MSENNTNNSINPIGLGENLAVFILNYSFAYEYALGNGNIKDKKMIKMSKKFDKTCLRNAGKIDFNLYREVAKQVREHFIVAKEVGVYDRFKNCMLREQENCDKYDMPFISDLDKVLTYGDELAGKTSYDGSFKTAAINKNESSKGIGDKKNITVSDNVNGINTNIADVSDINSGKNEEIDWNDKEKVCQTLRKNREKSFAEQRNYKDKEDSRFDEKYLADIFNGIDETINDKYNRLGIKKWCQGVKTVKIGDKYLNVDNEMWEDISSGSSMHSRDYNINITNSKMMQYATSPKATGIYDFFKINSCVDSIVYCEATGAMGILYGRTTNIAPSFFLYNEDFVYDFYKKITGVSDSVYIKKLVDKNNTLTEKEDRISSILYNIINYKTR